MGVTAHFFAFDPKRYTVVPTMDRWLASGELDRELQIADNARAWIKEIHSPLGDNKRWYDNLDADFAWTCARKHLAESDRRPLDLWFSHLFWDAGDHACPCGFAPLEVAPQELIYDRSLLDHLAALRAPMFAIEPALVFEFDGQPPRTERLQDSWIYDYDGFTWLVDAWHHIVAQARKAGPDWSLMRWVWY
jgi:hypothetical protein